MKKVIISLLALVMLFAMVSCTEEIYTFTFQTNGGTLVNDEYEEIDNTISLSAGEIATSQKVIRDGYAFDGWYADAACTKEYDFDKPVYGNTTVYAKWDQAFVTITATSDFYFTADGGCTDLQCSLDGFTWKSYQEWKEEEDPIVKKGVFDENSAKLLLRGHDKTFVTGSSGTAWMITSDKNGTVANQISFTCNGNILTLIDYQKVKAEETVVFGDYAFANMFAGTKITSAPDLSSIGCLTTGCFENLFSGTSIAATATKPTTVVNSFKFSADDPSVSCDNMFGSGSDTLITGTTYYYN